MREISQKLKTGRQTLPYCHVPSSKHIFWDQNNKLFFLNLSEWIILTMWTATLNHINKIFVQSTCCESISLFYHLAASFWKKSQVFSLKSCLPCGLKVALGVPKNCILFSRGVYQRKVQCLLNCTTPEPPIGHRIWIIVVLIMSDRTLPIHFDTSYAWMRVLISKSHWLNDAEFQSLPAFPPVLFSQKKTTKPGIVLANSHQTHHHHPSHQGYSRYLQKVINWACET